MRAVILFALLSTILPPLIESKPRDILVNTYVERLILLDTNQYTTINHKIIFQNLADYNVSVYKFELEPSIGIDFRYTIWIENGTMLHAPLVKYIHNNITHRYIQINLLEPLKPGAKSNIYVKLVLFNYIKPVAEFRRLRDPQWLMYKGYRMYYSAYNTYDQVLLFGIREIGEFELTPDQLLRSDEHLVQYGPYKYVEHYTEKGLVFKFQSSKPLIVVEKLDRRVDASSLFGLIQIVDEVILYNAGGKLKNEYHHNVDEYTFNSTKNSRIREVITFLPASAQSIQYYDNVGTIYSIVTEQFYDHVNCRLKLRYPIYGGWRIKYTIQYTVLANEYLFFRKNQFTLYARLFDHIYTDMLIMESVTRIILPVGAHNLTYVLPKNSNDGSSLVIKRLKDETVSSLLLMPDRLVMKFYMWRTIDTDLNDIFHLRFNLNPQPWLLGVHIVSLFALFLLAVVLFQHYEFTIRRSPVFVRKWKSLKSELEIK